MNQDVHSLLTDTNSPIAVESGYESVNEVANPRKFPQYFAAFAATLSAVAAGAVLSWTSPILPDLEKGNFNNITLTENQIGWIGSFVTLGGMAICIPAGFLCDLIGRKTTLLLLIVPFSTGWLLILLAKNVYMLYFGRLITGLAAGGCCTAAPLYTSEIAHKTLRGTLASYLQLMVTVGILLAYILGKYLTPIVFTISCAIIPLIFVVIFVIQPESPTYLIKKGRCDQAKLSLVKLRGKDFDVDGEMEEIEACLKESARTTYSFRETIRKRTVVKAFVITFALYFFQQFSGINDVIFYTTDIFKQSSARIDAHTASILVGVFQVITTFVSSVTIDRLGRRILLMTSSLVISFSTLLLAVYFTLQSGTHPAKHTLAVLGFLPVTAVCIFIVAYSLGLGPIPWIIPVEIFPTEIQSVTSSIGGTFNWFLAFVLTKSYQPIVCEVGKNSVFFIFGIVSFFGAVFVYFFLPETKGKTNIEIQADLEG